MGVAVPRVPAGTRRPEPPQKFSHGPWKLNNDKKHVHMSCPYLLLIFKHINLSFNCQQPSAFWNPLPLGCWRHMWTLPNCQFSQSSRNMIGALDVCYSYINSGNLLTIVYVFKVSTMSGSPCRISVRPDRKFWLNRNRIILAGNGTGLQAWKS